MKKVTVFLVIFCLLIIICINCYAKYIITSEHIIANINIDGVIPKIEMINIRNTNSKYYNYASRKHTITIKLKVIEKNIIKNNFNKEHIKILVGEKETIPKTYDIKEISKDNENIIYEIKLSEILGDGKLKIKVEQATIVDKGEQVNEERNFETGIIIDNISPITKFEQKEISEGKIKANVNINEEIQNINAWEMSEDRKNISKDFECNVTYPLKVYDYAENSTEFIINITKATNIKILYGANNEDGKWSFGKGNGELAGKTSILNNPQNRTEAISFYSEGNLEKDFFQIQAYAHTYWGEGIQGRCYTYETRYNSGYNPSANEYHSLKSGNIINLNGNYSLLIGGTAMNRKGNKGYGGKPIPEDISKQHLFGISALKIKLKDSSYYSVVYQLWNEEKGWLEAKSDDIESKYSYDKPIGGYRISLIPKTEKQYLIEYWNRDIGSKL